MTGSEQDRKDEREDILVTDEPFEKDRDDRLIEGERAGISSDGDGEGEGEGEREAERVGE